MTAAELIKVLSAHPDWEVEVETVSHSGYLHVAEYHATTPEVQEMSKQQKFYIFGA